MVIRSVQLVVLAAMLPLGGAAARDLQRGSSTMQRTRKSPRDIRRITRGSRTAVLPITLAVLAVLTTAAAGGPVEVQPRTPLPKGDPPLQPPFEHQLTVKFNDELMVRATEGDVFSLSGEELPVVDMVIVDLGKYKRPSISSRPWPMRCGPRRRRSTSPSRWSCPRRRVSTTRRRRRASSRALTTEARIRA
jgi:hypothetical protein